MNNANRAFCLAVRFILCCAVAGACLSVLTLVSAVVDPVSPLHLFFWPGSGVLHWFGIYYANAMVIWLTLLLQDFAGDRMAESRKSAEEKRLDALAAELMRATPRANTLFRPNLSNRRR